MTKAGWVRVVVGVVLVAVGGLWFLQGIGVVGGSVMSGVAFWAFAGAVAFVAGLVVIFRPGRRA